MNNGYGMMSMPISVETLTSLVKQRDYLQQQINTFTGALTPYKGINVMPPEAMAMLDALAEAQQLLSVANWKTWRKRFWKCKNSSKAHQRE